MSLVKLQAQRALKVIPSDTAVIPFPAVLQSGTNTSASTNLLISSSATFITNNVTAGDIVYNNTDGTIATVVSVQSETQLTLAPSIFGASSKSFTVYQQSAQSGTGNQGCLLYVGTGGNITVVTNGNDTVTFTNIQSGTFVPVIVFAVKATGTTSSNIVALW